MESRAIVNSTVTPHHSPSRDSLSDQITFILKRHIPPKVIAKVIKDPRLFHFMEKLLTQHSANDILEITVTSDRGQLTIKARLSHDVKQCGVTTETDGFTRQGKCITSRIISSESTIILARSYIARLLHPSRPQKPTAPTVVKEEVPKLPKPEMSLVDRYNAMADGPHYSPNSAVATRLVATEKKLLREALFKPMSATEEHAASSSCRSGHCTGSPLCLGRKLYENFVHEGALYMCVPCENLPMPGGKPLHFNDNFVPSHEHPGTNDWDAAESVWYKNILAYLIDHPGSKHEWSKKEVVIFHRQAVINGRIDPVVNPVPSNMRREAPAKSSAVAVMRDLSDWNLCVSIGRRAFCIDTRERDSDPKVMKARSEFMHAIAKAVQHSGNANL